MDRHTADLLRAALQDQVNAALADDNMDLALELFCEECDIYSEDEVDEIDGMSDDELLAGLGI